MPWSWSGLRRAPGRDGGCARAERRALSRPLAAGCRRHRGARRGSGARIRRHRRSAKFFATLAEAGVTVAATRSFPDHHRYTRAEAQELCDEADRARLTLVTTEKDLARLIGDEEATQLAAHARALPVALAFENAEGFKSRLLERMLDVRRQM
jgi:tetraacyldisaccharide 4'-kinase